MENKDIVISTINETKLEIKSFRQELLSKQKELPEIKTIANSLKGIEKFIEDIKKLCNTESKTLQDILNELTKVQIEELLSKTEIMIHVISENLPKGMELHEDPFEDAARNIYFNGDLIGTIVVAEDSDEILKITVNINTHVYQFEVDNPYKMYPIISFINTNLSYE